MPPLYALMFSNVYFLQIEQKKSTILSTSHFSDFISLELFKFLQTSLWVLRHKPRNKVLLHIIERIDKKYLAQLQVQWRYRQF